VGEKVRLRVAIESDGASWKPLGIEGRVVAVQNDSIQILKAASTSGACLFRKCRVST
jgi:hypothetical protein